MPQYILSIDQGTTGTTSALINRKGQIVAKANQEFEQIFPRPGWVEHNPEHIWQSVVSTIQKVLDKSGVKSHEIEGIGITNQRETTLVWNRKTGIPVYNAIVWQCRRTTDFCAKLKLAGKENWVNKKTGLVIDPYFSASKFRWILENVPGAKQKAKMEQLVGGTVDTYLLWRLTKGEAHCTDVSNASRTMLMNIDKGEWDSALLNLFSVPQSLLPKICASNGTLGKTRSVPGLPDGIPIAGIAGDQQAALFGQACFSIGDAKCTFGTGSFLLMNTGSKRLYSKSRILTTVAWQLADDKKLTYALEGGAFVCGAAVQWLRDGLNIISSSSEIEDLAKTVEDTGGVEFVPALTGLGAPYWDARARGMICGLTRGSTKAHIARATLEAMALQNVDILSAMQKDLGKKLRHIKVDGGAVANNLLMQLQANYLGQSIYRPKMIESTVMGAGYLAGLGTGYWDDISELKKIWSLDREFKVEINSANRKKRLNLWHSAIRKSRL